MIQDMINSETIWIQLNRQTQTYSRLLHLRSPDRRVQKGHNVAFISQLTASTRQFSYTISDINPPMAKGVDATLNRFFQFFSGMWQAFFAN